jgi:hypothetical protein
LLSYALGDESVTLPSSAGFDTTRISFNTVIYDPDSLITTGTTTWVWTAPHLGIYRIEGVTFADQYLTSWVDGDYVELYLVENTTFHVMSLSSQSPPAATGDFMVTLPGHITMGLEEGNTIRFNMRNYSANAHRGTGGYIAIYEGPAVGGF